MTPTRLRECLTALGWSQRGLAAHLGCNDALTRGWAAGRTAIPEVVAEWLELLACLHERHPAPRGWQTRSGRAAQTAGSEGKEGVLF